MNILSWFIYFLLNFFSFIFNFPHIAGFFQFLFTKLEYWEWAVSSFAETSWWLHIVRNPLLCLKLVAWKLQLRLSHWFYELRYVESNPQYAESAVYLVKFRQLQVLYCLILSLLMLIVKYPCNVYEFLGECFSFTKKLEENSILKCESLSSMLLTLLFNDFHD